jgi:hypothetical protein
MYIFLSRLGGLRASRTLSLVRNDTTPYFSFPKSEDIWQVYEASMHMRMYDHFKIYLAVHNGVSIFTSAHF